MRIQNQQNLELEDETLRFAIQLNEIPYDLLAQDMRDCIDTSNLTDFVKPRIGRKYAQILKNAKPISEIGLDKEIQIDYENPEKYLNLEDGRHERLFYEKDYFRYTRLEIVDKDGSFNLFGEDGVAKRRPERRDAIIRSLKKLSKEDKKLLFILEVMTGQLTEWAGIDVFNRAWDASGFHGTSFTPQTRIRSKKIEKTSDNQILVTCVFNCTLRDTTEMLESHDISFTFTIAKEEDQEWHCSEPSWTYLKPSVSIQEEETRKQAEEQRAKQSKETEQMAQLLDKEDDDDGVFIPSSLKSAAAHSSSVLAATAVAS